jgi:hypothetical protein
MVATQLTQATITWMEGLIGFIVVLLIVLNFWSNLRKARYEAEATKTAAKVTSDKEKEEAVQKAIIEAKKETASEIAFRDLQSTVEKMNDTVRCMSDTVTKDINSIRATDVERVRWMTEIDASAKAAHKRLDVHRIAEHGVANDAHFKFNETATAEST